VTDPFSRHPALTAMAIATLDEVSGGRGILGIGAGISGFAELGLYRSKPARAICETIEGGPGAAARRERGLSR
jgi:5,10-methylenetetrahydromethanopterin reductase